MLKTSVAISTFPGWKGMPALFSGTGDDILAEIKCLGYDGVDLFVDTPGSESNLGALRRLKKYGLKVGAIMPALLSRQGISLGDQDKDARLHAIKKIEEMICFASDAKGMVSLGLVRGNIAGSLDSQKEEFLKRFSDSCEKLLRIAEPLCVPLLVEPINRYETDNLNSSREALEFIENSGLSLKLMLDTFHMNIEDCDLNESFKLCSPYVKHVHFLDSNRLAPGMGHLNMADLYRTLEHIGYDGFLCLEALPYPSGLEVAKRGAEFFRKVSM